MSLLPRRFSLRTLLLAMLTLGAAAALWRNYDPWRVEHQFPGQGKVRGFSPDGKWINADLEEYHPSKYRVKSLLWNVETGQAYQLDHGMRDGSLSCRSRFSSDSAVLFSSVDGPAECTAKVWDLKTQSERDISALKRNDYFYAELSPKGRYVDVRFNNSPAELIDLQTNTSVVTDSYECAVFSPSDDRVVLLRGGASLRILETATGRELQRIESPKEWYFNWPPYLAERYLLISVSPSDHPANQKGFLLYALKEDRAPVFYPGYSMKISSDETQALVSEAEERVTLIDLRTQQILAHLSSDSMAQSFEWIDNKARLLDKAQSVVFETATGKLIFETDLGVACPSPDQERMIWYNIYSDSPEKVLRIHNLRSGELLQTLDGEEITGNSSDIFADSRLSPKDRINPDTFAPDSRHIVTVNKVSKAIRIWKRHRPERWWGLAWLPEFWLLLCLAAGFLWSLRRDWKSAAISTTLPLAGMGNLQ